MRACIASGDTSFWPDEFIVDTIQTGGKWEAIESTKKDPELSPDVFEMAGSSSSLGERGRTREIGIGRADGEEFCGREVNWERSEWAGGNGSWGSCSAGERWVLVVRAPAGGEKKGGKELDSDEKVSLRTVDGQGRRVGNRYKESFDGGGMARSHWTPGARFWSE